MLIIEKKRNTVNEGVKCSVKNYSINQKTENERDDKDKNRNS